MDKRFVKQETPRTITHEGIGETLKEHALWRMTNGKGRSAG